jgi:hypothetical protein
MMHASPRYVALAAALIAFAPAARAQDYGLFTTMALTASILKPQAPAHETATRRPHAIWSAIRFTVKEYPLMPFARLRQLGVGSIYPHFGRLRVTPKGVELYDFYGNVLWPDQKSEMKKMVARLHAEGFRVIPWISVKRAKPEGSFWIYDDWTPMLATTRALIDELGIDGFQLDPEPLNVRDVPALNTGLGWMRSVMGGRELSVAVPQMVAGTPEHESGFRWPDTKAYQQLTHADSLCLMTYDTRLDKPADYQALIHANVAVAKAMQGRARVYLGMPSYPNAPLKNPPKHKGHKKGKGPAKPAPRAAHLMPPEDGRNFAAGLKGHPDLKYLAGIAVYDLEEPEDLNWLAAWKLAEAGLEEINGWFSGAAAE